LECDQSLYFQLTYTEANKNIRIIRKSTAARIVGLIVVIIRIIMYYSLHKVGPQTITSTATS
jgi:hypothetical protein